MKNKKNENNKMTNYHYLIQIEIFEQMLKEFVKVEEVHSNEHYLRYQGEILEIKFFETSLKLLKNQFLNGLQYEILK